MEDVFRALGDPSRRILLDRLFERDGQTLGELVEGLGMTRFGVMKHLKILENANLITTRKVGREKLHYLNPIPIRLLHDRWISKFAEPWTGGMADLKRTLEAEPMSKPSHTYTVYIRTTPEQLWQALTDGEMTRSYFHNTRVASSWKTGAPVTYLYADGETEDAVAVEGTVLEADPPRKLSFTWHSKYDPEAANERPSRVTFEIARRGEACQLTLIHDDFEGETSTYLGISQGWGPLLNSLKTLLETGTPLDYGG